ncbi:MAG: MerR family transcriptional regulator [Pseudorhodoplanes sp.]
MNSEGRKAAGNVEWAQMQRDPDQSEADRQFYTIGELAQEFGLTLRALRFYEDKGLITPQRRGVTRLYSPQDRQRVARIVKGKNLGFTLGEIRDLVAVEEQRSDSSSLNLSREKCLEQISLLEKQKHQIESALNELRRVYAALSTKDMSAKGEEEKGG